MLPIGVYSCCIEDNNQYQQRKLAIWQIALDVTKRRVFHGCLFPISTPTKKLGLLRRHKHRMGCHMQSPTSACSEYKRTRQPPASHKLCPSTRTTTAKCSPPPPPHPPPQVPRHLLQIQLRHSTHHLPTSHRLTPSTDNLRCQTRTGSALSTPLATGRTRTTRWNCSPRARRLARRGRSFR